MIDQHVTLALINNKEGGKIYGGKDRGFKPIFSHWFFVWLLQLMDAA